MCLTTHIYDTETETRIRGSDACGCCGAGGQGDKDGGEPPIANGAAEAETLAPIDADVTTVGGEPAQVTTGDGKGDSKAVEPEVHPHVSSNGADGDLDAHDGVMDMLLDAPEDTSLVL